MRTIAKLTVGAAIMLALAGPSLAASRQRAVMSGDVNTVRTYGDLDPANPPYRGSGVNVRRYWGGVDNTGHPYQVAPGQNLPYPDRPYGDPDID
ncbi:MAG: hypothetical protein K2Z80_01235 [Xanthobacteraceae bacterium]|nr:hypothetical protein [Xanthobacteraceae bacterium]